MRIPPSLFDIPSRPLADAFNIRYSTKYYDAESDLYYYGYRYYAPSLHRWLTRDPIAEEGGLNLYGFCENQVPHQVDSIGLARMLTGSLVPDFHIWGDSVGQARAIFRYLSKMKMAKTDKGESRYEIEIGDMALTPVDKMRADVESKFSRSKRARSEYKIT